MKFCVTDFWISKLHMTGVSKILHYIFVRKFFSIFRVRFKQNLNQILKIVKIEITNIKENPTEVAKKLHYIPWGLN